MLLALLLAFTSFLFSLILTPLARDFFKRFGFLDHPNDPRKTHLVPIPHVGGIAITLSIALSVGITAVLGLWRPFLYYPAMAFMFRLLPAVGIIFVVGILDDLFRLKPWQKLLGELVGAGIAYAAGLRVMGIGGFTSDNWITLPLTLFWLILCTNAFNLIDGVDGLATGAGIFATLTILLAGIIDKNGALVLAAVPLAGALLGFLRYNFNPATVFLGDSGSLLIGFLLGCFGVIWSLKTATIFGIIAPMMAMFVPLLDVVLSVVRRFLRGQPIFGADRGHVHHRLLDRGLTPRRAVFLLYGACAFGATLSLFQSVLQRQYGGVVILLFCMGTWIGIQHLGYLEFRTAGRVFTGGLLQRMINSQIQLREFENALVGCGGATQCWTLVCQKGRELGLAGIEIEMASGTLKETFESDASDCWTMHVPLGQTALLELTIPSGVASQSELLLPFVSLLASKLPDKFRTLNPIESRSVSTSLPQELMQPRAN
jgi:UDP-GlcNAc:undecaprenyl-phosphate/decaprenyl-phosphate GlcNAc-1-phosphate transferase